MDFDKPFLDKDEADEIIDLIWTDIVVENQVNEMIEDINNQGS